MGRVWLHCLGATTPPELAACERELISVGVPTTAWSGDEARGTGLLFLEEINQTVLDFLRTTSRGGVERVVAVTTGDTLGPGGWQLLQAGACDLIRLSAHPASIRDLAARIRRLCEVDDLLQAPLIRDHLVGRSHAWISTLRQMVEVSRFTSSSVLIVGESGTGKELLARLIHALDPRPDKGDLVLLDCTTLVHELSGSELFGHERGAFTGAAAARDGVFAMADGGTLFLDEVGELPLPLQAQLLRAIQERTYKRVGGNAWQRVNFRLVCATNRNLLEAVERGEFRRDLYFRLAGWCCTPPPLRDRLEDVLPLAEHFMGQARPDGRSPGFDPLIREHLLRREYPGNVRDLRQLMQRIACRHVGDGPVTAGALPMEEWPTDPQAAGWIDQGFEKTIRRAITLGASLKDISRVASETAVRVALDDAEGNLQRAARQLGVTDRALQMRRASRRPIPDEIDA